MVPTWPAMDNDEHRQLRVAESPDEQVHGVDTDHRTLSKSSILHRVAHHRDNVSNGAGRRAAHLRTADPAAERRKAATSSVNGTPAAWRAGVPLPGPGRDVPWPVLSRGA